MQNINKCAVVFKSIGRVAAVDGLADIVKICYL
jgi:hypothetical protein